MAGFPHHLVIAESWRLESISLLVALPTNPRRSASRLGQRLLRLLLR